jgi:predicted sulfurtransferase
MSVVELEEFRKAMRHDPDFNKLWRKMSLPQRKAFYRYTVKMAAERYAGCGYGGENA